MSILFRISEIFLFRGFPQRRAGNENAGLSVKRREKTTAPLIYNIIMVPGMPIMKWKR